MERFAENPTAQGFSNDLIQIINRISRVGLIVFQVFAGLVDMRGSTMNDRSSDSHQIA